MSCHQFGCSSICSLPFLVGWVFPPRPLSGSVLERAGAILGWHGQGSWLNFICSLHISLSLFHKSSCCHQSATSFFAAFIFHFHFPHIILLPSSCTPARPRYAPWDLLPPSAGPPRRVHFVLVFPPKSLPSPVYFHLGNLWLPLLVGRGFARCRLVW